MAEQAPRTAVSEVAQIILDQMGGVRRLQAMLGAKDFLYDAKSVQFKWPNRQRSKGNHVKVTLRGDDTYDVVFSNVGGLNFKTVKEYHGIYADQLVELFERQTGYRLRLGAARVAARWMGRRAGARVGMKRNFPPPEGSAERDGWDKCMDLDPNQRQRALRDVTRNMDQPGQRAFGSGWLDCWETIGKTPWDRIPSKLKG